MITQQEKEAFFIELHRIIEDAATQTAAALRTQKIEFAYPPNAGLSQPEQEALASLVVTPDLESALRKVIADAAGEALIHLFCLIDGVGDPINYEGEWLGIKLERADEDEEEEGMLHDEFLEHYWSWRKVRGDRGWRLDTYEG